MRFLTMLVTVAMSAGCITYPAAGYVIVDVSPKVQALTSTDADGVSQLHPADYIGAGLHYWDAVGCHFALPSEAPNAIGAHLEIVEAADIEAATVGGGEVIAWFDSFDGKIKVNARRLPQSFPEDWAQTWAHEAGHALGLGHIDGHAVMNPSEGGVVGLQPADVALFQRTRH